MRTLDCPRMFAADSKVVSAREGNALRAESPCSWKQIIEKIDDALSAAREEVLKEVRAIIDEEIENESTHDDERGHGQSLHLGAMEALQTLKERLKHDRY